MSKYTTGQLDIKSHQQTRPNDGVEPEDIFADQLNVGGPISPSVLLVGVIQGGDIIAQGVHPNVNGVGRIVGHLYAPFESWAGNSQISQAFFYP